MRGKNSVLCIPSLFLLRSFFISFSILLFCSNEVKVVLWRANAANRVQCTQTHAYVHAYIHISAYTHRMYNTETETRMSFVAMRTWAIWLKGNYALLMYPYCPKMVTTTRCCVQKFFPLAFCCLDRQRFPYATLFNRIWINFIINRSNGRSEFESEIGLYVNLNRIHFKRYYGNLLTCVIVCVMAHFQCRNTSTHIHTHTHTHTNIFVWQITIAT